MKPLLVTVARFHDLFEGGIARAALQANGIEAQLCDENMVRIDWGVTNVIGGMRLQVRTDDVEDALLVLNSTSAESDLAVEEKHEEY